MSAYLSRLAPGALIAHTAGDIHPPGYYLLLHTWRLLDQPTLLTGLEFGLAWPSVLWGMLITVLVAAIGRKLFDARVAVLALWFAAVNPFHIWYSQEVRMYTQGAALALLCLWFRSAGAMTRAASPRWWDMPRRPRPDSTPSTISASLVALAVITLIALARMTHGPLRRGAFVRWLLAQAGVLPALRAVLTILWRQATDPPGAAVAATLVIATRSDSVRHREPGRWSPASRRRWSDCGPGPWSHSCSFMAVCCCRRNGEHGSEPAAPSRLLLYVTIPVALILLATLLGTPLYHVRYGFVYALAFAVLAPWWWMNCCAGVSGWAGAGVALLPDNGGRRRLLTNPRYRADDHRGAVAVGATMAAGRRHPGQRGLGLHCLGHVLAAAAGRSPWRAAPGRPLPALRQRLTDYVPQLDAGRLPATGDEPGVIGLTTGSIDGPASLGWGDPASDFYAMRRAETIAALDAVSARHLAVALSHLRHGERSRRRHPPG
ncbi:MAG: hypothetical protein R2854_03165 [Caldilineaceae bacterium]